MKPAVAAVLRLAAAAALFAGTAAAQPVEGPLSPRAQADVDQRTRSDGQSASAPTPPSADAPDAPAANADQPESTAARRLTTRGYARASGTYVAENTDSPLAPIAGVRSSGFGRLVGNLRPDYQPFGDKRLTLAADVFAVASSGDGAGSRSDSLDLLLPEAYVDVHSGPYRVVAGKRNALHSVGYFRYPLDFYETPSLVTTGAEDPRRVIETRNGPLLAGVERQWSFGSAALEYLPKLSSDGAVDWHSNQQQQVIGRAAFVRGAAALNLAIQHAFARERRSDVDGRPLRSQAATQFGVSSTYVVGAALELHAETSFGRDQRLPVATDREFHFEPPVGTVTLPVWLAAPQAGLVETLLGGQYTFDDRTWFEGWNVIVEYDYQAAGWTRTQWDSFFDQASRLERIAALAASARAPLPSQLQQLAGDFGRRTADLLHDRAAFWGRHYGFLRLSRTDLRVSGLEVAAYAIPSLQDFSFVAGANVAYEPQGGFQLRVDVRYLGGPGRSEFGRLPARALAQVEIGYGF